MEIYKTYAHKPGQTFAHRPCLTAEEGHEQMIFLSKVIRNKKVTYHLSDGFYTFVRFNRETGLEIIRQP